VLLLAACVAVACAPATPVPPAATPPAAPTAEATSPSPEMQGEATPASTGRLVSQRVTSPPVVDGRLDAVWASSEARRMPIISRLAGEDRTWDIELRALHTDEAVYFLAQWTGELPSGDMEIVSNKLTVHWRIPEEEAAERHLDCNVVCHTAFADGQGRFVYANAETIPHGGSETLEVAGGWHDGLWTLEWSRPLVTGNPFDLQFTDLDRAYLLFVKLFDGGEGGPDAISEGHELVFQP
jgi:hypothetical protein